MKFWSAAAFAALIAVPSIAAVPDGFVDERVLGPGQFPTDMVWTPQGQLLVILKEGEVRVYEDEPGAEPYTYGKMTEALDISEKVCTENERGLGGIQVHPNFEENRWVYLYYTTDKFGNCDMNKDNGPVNRLSRFVLQENNIIDPASEVIFFDTLSLELDYHNAGRIEFGKDGYLYTTTGDGGSKDAVQDPSNLLGAMIRLTDDGGIPPGNPYASDPDGVRCNVNGKAEIENGKCQELYALGLRNPFRFSMDPNVDNVRFIINNVGASLWESQFVGGDDVDGTQYTFGLPNYGWPDLEGPCNRPKTGGCEDDSAEHGFIPPYHFYQHQDGGANTASAFVPNGIWPTEYDNGYLYADYVFGEIYLLKDTGSENCLSCSPATSSKEVSSFHSYDRVISMRFGPYIGCTPALYYTSMGSGGELRRISYISSQVNVDCVEGNTTFTPVGNQTTAAPCLPCSLGIVANETDLVSGSPFINEECGFFAVQQNDGNLVVYYGTPDNPGAEIWDSNGYENVTVNGDFYTTIQEDGNVVTWAGTPDSKGGIIWDIGFSGEEGEYFFGIDCNLEVVSIYQGTPNTTGSAVWNSAPTPMPVAMPTASPSLSPTAEPLAAEGGYPGDLFPWSTDCPDGYNFCGMLEFCMADEMQYGYRLPCMEEEEEDCDCLGISGPLIRLVPGNKYRMTLRNAAPESEITNIHTHGLHIVGAGDGDDVLRTVSGGGNCLDYTWDIAEDHPGGTYWYHAHHHGFTHVQVEGGAFGLLIVEDNTFTDPDVPSWAANERLLQVSISSVKGNVGNGKTNEVIDIEADQWYRLRVSIVAAYVEPKNFTFDDLGDCNVTKVATDGIWRSSIPGPSATVFELTGASVADFAIRCRTPNSLVPLQYGDDVVATIRVGSAELNPHVMEEWKPKRPSSLQDLTALLLPQENTLVIMLGFDYVNDQLWTPKFPSIPLRMIRFINGHCSRRLDTRFTFTSITCRL